MKKYFFTLACILLIAWPLLLVYALNFDPGFMLPAQSIYASFVLLLINVIFTVIGVYFLSKSLLSKKEIAILFIQSLAAIGVGCMAYTLTNGF